MLHLLGWPAPEDFAPRFETELAQVDPKDNNINVPTANLTLPHFVKANIPNLIKPGASTLPPERGL
ncbi:MAG: hypothetical protein ACTHLW_05275 [Verrucomicrobiota bacterium]